MIISEGGENMREEKSGRLLVRVTTANGILPLENAEVSTKGKYACKKRTFRDGFAPTIEIKSEKEGVYTDLEVSAKGYMTRTERQIPIYPGVTTVWYVILERENNSESQ